MVCEKNAPGPRIFCSGVMSPRDLALDVVVARVLSPTGFVRRLINDFFSGEINEAFSGPALELRCRPSPDDGDFFPLTTGDTVTAGSVNIDRM